ncbi:FAD-dependent oxidoreductase [Novosphingobium panipatense]
MSLIGIIGGGVVGLSTGIELLQAGHRVALVDDDAAGQAASWGNAGHIAVEQVEPLASWAMVRSLPHRLFLRGGAASFPPGAVAEWLPFGLRLLSAGRPKRFATGCAAMAPLMDRALPAWSSLLHRIGAQDLLRSDGHLVCGTAPQQRRPAAEHGRAHALVRPPCIRPAAMTSQPCRGSARGRFRAPSASAVRLRSPIWVPCATR